MITRSRSIYATQDEDGAAAAAALPSIPKELIDQFVSGPMGAEAVNAASMAFKKWGPPRAECSCCKMAAGCSMAPRIAGNPDRR